MNVKQLSNRLFELYSQSDSAVAHIKEAYPGLVPCKPGCTDCCHAVFDVSLAEAVMIACQFSKLNRNIRRLALKHAQKALDAWEKQVKSGADLSHARIRCPLLSPQNLCICYEVRPVNCRTYGVPTAFNGKSHVCGLTNFKKGETYTTLNLDPLHAALYELSRQLISNPAEAAQRLPLSTVILSADKLSGILRL